MQHDDATPQIEAQGLTKRYGDSLAVDTVNIQVFPVKSLVSWGQMGPERQRQSRC
jgi:ABC-type phosphonate transport system ATPase subunit